MACGSVAQAVARDASPAELEGLGRAPGIADADLARVLERRAVPRTSRARGTHLGTRLPAVVLGWEPVPEGGARMRGQISRLARPVHAATVAWRRLRGAEWL
ncbi:MAG: hypothetical protein JWR63_2559 [Conexibacter sp.]|nr:hypothetical protein [Conexibacter sp.]